MTYRLEIDDEIKLADNHVSCNITFYSLDGKKVGEFNFDQSPATFVGDVDASAQIFVDMVIKLWGERYGKQLLWR